MKKFLLIFLLLASLISVVLVERILNSHNIISGAPPYHVDSDPLPFGLSDKYSWIRDWERPEGPPKVGLQVGHYKNEELPDELHRLRGNTGAQGGGKSEWEVNLEIVTLTKELLEQEGVIVDVLPATIPPNYWADAFVAIHADGSLDLSKSGYKGSAPRRDFTENADELLLRVEEAYEDATSLPYDPNVTRNMRGYYAFSFWRFEHALHPMTTAIILETGFLTSARDREIIVTRPELSAQGIANGILEYLKSKELLS